MNHIIDHVHKNSDLYSPKETAIISAMCDEGAGNLACSKVFDILDTEIITKLINDEQKEFILEATLDVVNLVSCYIPSSIYAVAENLSLKYFDKKHIYLFSMKAVASERATIVKSYLENILKMNKINPMVIEHVTNQACAGFTEFILNVIDKNANN
jgi:hypothetical protein